MVTALFPAAGQGKRMQAGLNKVFLELKDKPILIHTLLKFSACASIDDLIVVVAPDEVDFIARLLSHVPGLKPYQVVAGGSERQYSIDNGLKKLLPDTEVILVHDAARPLVSAQTIEAVVAAAREVGGAIAAVPAKNTVKIVHDGLVSTTPPRETVWEVQTPQGFRREIIEQAYERAAADGFLGTDDASLVERLGAPVKVVQSSYQNIKVTTPEDLLIAEAFLGADGEGVTGALKNTIERTKERLTKHLKH